MANDLTGQLREIYARRFDEQRRYRDRVWKVLVADFLQRFVNPGDAVLDLGCGYGQFINHVHATTKYAMDLNPQSREMISSDITFLERDCSIKWPLPDGALDLVFSSNFFEHLPAKSALEKTVQEAARCLKKGGQIIAMGPNIRCVGGAYWDFWDHHIPLTERSLSELVMTNGFRVERAISRFLPYTMVDKREMPIFVIKLYLRFRFAWRFWGSQFLVVARKV
jgi:SAM-dependent methyltransferase